MRKLRTQIGALAAVVALALAGPARSAGETKAAVPGYGATQAVTRAAALPDPALRYRVVFSITKPAEGAAEVNPGLEKVARLLNLLAERGISPKPGDVVAVVHGKATPSVLRDEAYRRRNQAANPNLELITRLREAGAEVHVCGQALASQKISADEVLASVQVDLSALTTLSTLQLRGYALIPD